MRPFLLLFVSSVLFAQQSTKIQLGQVLPPSVDTPRIVMITPMPLASGGTVMVWLQVALGTGLTLDTSEKVPVLRASSSGASLRDPVVLNGNVDGVFVPTTASCTVGLVFRNGLLQWPSSDYSMSGIGVKFADTIAAGERIVTICK